MKQANTQTKLQEQIAKLQKEAALEEKAALKLGHIDHSTIIHGWAGKEKERIIIKPKNLDEFKAALLAYPATNEKTVIGTATDKYYKELATPYRLDIDNPASPNQWHNFKLTVNYWSNNIDIDIELPIEFIKEFINHSERNITDSEYHYFIGRSHSELRNIRVRCYNFKGNQMGWYGGSKTLLSEPAINEIINYLLK